MITVGLWLTLRGGVFDTVFRFVDDLFCTSLCGFCLHLGMCLFRFQLSLYFFWQ